MENFDRITKIREQQPIPDYETPPARDDVAKVRARLLFPKILSILLIAVLVLTVV